MRTPSPLPTESPLGFVLRVSETNGYPTPWHVYDLAGVKQRSMLTIGLDVLRIAAVLGKDPSTLRSLALAQFQGGTRRASLLGRAISPKMLRLTRPAICPQCVAENGFIGAHFDLAYVTACPDHYCLLLSTCPSCGNALSQFRPGLLTCRCGHDLLKAALAQASHDVVALTGVLKYVATGCTSRALQEAERERSLPTAQLANMSLRALLSLVTTLGRHGYSSSASSRKRAPECLVDTASRALTDWPQGFYALLHNKLRTALVPESSALRNRLEGLYRLLFRSRAIRKDEFAFVREAFLRFGVEESGECFVDPKLLHGMVMPENARFLSKAQLASHLGVQRSTVTTMLARGVVPTKTVRSRSITRVIADIGARSLPRRAPGKSFGERKAAAIVGIPVSVLQRLRQTGEFEVHYLGRTTAAFHEEDLKDFIRKCVALAGDDSWMEHQLPEHICVAEAIRLKFGAQDGKAELLRAALEQRLPVVGRLGDSVGQLLLRRGDVERFLLDSRAAGLGATRSFSETAERIHCDSTVLPALIERKFLEAVATSTGRRITEASLCAFEKGYTSLAALAKSRSTSARQLHKDCRRRGIPLETFARTHSKSPQSFMRKELQPPEWVAV